ncbi:MAG: Asp-tRNA(Asn)/Glu-tRNA(Gln) amidotransferase subunit GatB [Candidatus Kapaibacteriota bacterium]
MSRNEKYEAIIGLEVHAQLLTETKAFCGCSTKFGDLPNTNTCPVCLGHPGTLPVLNKKMVEYAIKMGLATNCKIRQSSIFARKNYFYEDLPKGYQISQYDQPICYDGYIEIELSENTTKRIGITRIHMEEDTGKSIHDLDIDTLLDFNRCGVPLIEIVSEPDIRSAEEAYKYLEQLRQIVLYLGISTGNMEEGALRCDANISVRLKGSDKFGTKTEVKNLNSFRNVQKAIDYEIKRQIEVLENGGKINQETRLWDAAKHETKIMRTKEMAHDYRYFPEPDLVEVFVDDTWKNDVFSSIPELPMAKKKRLIQHYKIPNYDATILINDVNLAEFYEATVNELNEKTEQNFKLTSNWIQTEVLRVLSEQNIEIKQLNLSPKNLAELVELFSSEKISSRIAKDIFPEILQTGKSPNEIVKEKNLIQVSDESLIEEIVKKIIADNPENVEKYKNGKSNLFGFFVGQTMKATQGKANPKIINKYVEKYLNS